MNEKLMVCKALAAMVRGKGSMTEEEVAFVAHAAFELALSSEENTEVQQVMKTGGDYKSFIRQVHSGFMRIFLFRRVVAAVLLDEKIEDKEQVTINETAEVFGFNNEVVKQFVGWMQEGIAWERRGAEIMSCLRP